MSTPHPNGFQHWVTPIAQVSTDYTAQVGGKAANLGELVRSGFPVPAAFVISADAYLHAVESAGLRSALKDLPSPSEEPVNPTTLAEIRESIHNLEVPDDMRQEILAAYRELGPATTRVVVRSSAPAEDAYGTSYAGIHDSFTSINGDEGLVAAVTQCWASLWSDRALAYRSLQGVREEPSLAVVVQLMIDADRSGVVFTADPRDGSTERILIDAAVGLGEVVVGGQVEPDTYVVGKPSLAILESRIGSQAFALVVRDGVEQTLDLAQTDGEGQVLSDVEIHKVAELAVAVENHYGCPQDLEFAIQDGRLWLVQSRPITTLGQHLNGQGSDGKEPAASSLVQGLGAGPGSATGTVRVLSSLADGDALIEGEILVAAMTRPDWLPILRRAAAIVTDGGGITCHAAIVGRELGKPVVVGTHTATADLVTGMLVTVDGGTGTVQAARAMPVRTPVPTQPATMMTLKHGPWGFANRTTATAVYANLSTPEAAERVAATDVDGVGLLRAEFMIMDALDGAHPSKMLARGEHDSYVAKMSAALSRVAAAFGNRPVIYRAVDLRTNEFSHLRGGEEEPVEDNPMIGYRGCFRYVREPQLFALDLDVVAETRKQHSNVHLMIPFVRTRWELSQCLEQLDDHALGSDRRMLRWIMAEVPSVAYWIPQYAAMGIDGISIGTNDLTQLILGVDRDSEICRELFDTADPAVLEAIDVIIDRAAAAGMTTSLCGQAVSTDRGLAEHLVRKGINSVSVVPDSVDSTRRSIAIAERRIILEQARSQGKP